MKTIEIEGVRGYDAGKQVKGRKRPILVDTLGLLFLLLPILRTDAQKSFVVLPKRWTVERISV